MPRGRDGGLKLVGNLLGGATGVIGLELETVPDSRVVAGSEDGGGGGLEVQDVVANYRRGGGFKGQVSFDAVGRACFGDQFGEFLGEEPGVVPDH